MNTNSHNNTEDHTPQQTHTGTEMWGRRESGMALMLAATEPQVIRQLRVMGHRWRTQPRQDSEFETNLDASAILHTATTTQGQGEVGEATEWEGTDVGGDRTTGDLATEGEGHQWRTQPRQDSKIDLVASATGNHITSSNADTTQIGPPPPPPHHAPATTPAAPPTPHQHRHQQWRNTLTHATTIEGGPRQQRTAQKRRPGHRGPWVMSQ